MTRSRRRSVRKYYKKRTKKRSFKKKYTKKKYTKKKYTKKMYTKKRKYRRKKQLGGEHVCEQLPFGVDTDSDAFAGTSIQHREWVNEYIHRFGKKPTPEIMCIWGPNNRHKDCRWNGCATHKTSPNAQKGLCTSGTWSGPGGRRYEYTYLGNCKWRQKGYPSDFSVIDEF